MTGGRSIVCKLCLDHFEETSIRPRRRPPPNPRSAPPAPSDTTSAASARTPGTHPLGNHPSSAPGRTATGARSRGEGTPGPRTSAPTSVVLSARLEPAGQSPATRPRTARPSTPPSAEGVVPFPTGGCRRRNMRTGRPGRSLHMPSRFASVVTQRKTVNQWATCLHPTQSANGNGVPDGRRHGCRRRSVQPLSSLSQLLA